MGNWGGKEKTKYELQDYSKYMKTFEALGFRQEDIRKIQQVFVKVGMPTRTQEIIIEKPGRQHQNRQNGNERFP